MKEYTLKEYLADIDKKGLKQTWHSILSKTLNNKFYSTMFNIDNYGELYEIGLEHVNKISKKEMGKYYTPKDVAKVMSKWLKPLKGENVCDIGCGCGNLILTYLETIGKEKACKLISNGNIYLYDMDEIALEICKYSIAIKYGKQMLKTIHIKKCDFLNKNIKLPKNSKVISNPPYFKIKEYGEEWKITKVITESKELYSAFMEKIISQSKASVIITPYSFIGSEKFYSLRKIMNNYNGFIVSFDNVPGNIFNGKKHGIFNTNTGNSVRAAITVVENKENIKGFRVSPLIRFKTEERERVLDNKFLNSIINDRYQIVSSKEKAYYKCQTNLLKIYDKWEDMSGKKLSELINSNTGEEIYFPTTCRYFTVGAKRKLQRDGKIKICIKDKSKYNYIYCMINSSFAYWYWRLYDGGINCSNKILNDIPVFYDKLTEKQKKEIDEIAVEMQKDEENYLTYKMNAGKEQENIKFPKEYRNKINKLFFEALGINENINILNEIHSNSLFEKGENVENE